MRRWRWTAVLALALAVVAACGGDDDGGAADETPEPSGSGFAIASDSFQEGSAIPEEYGCAGEEQSPPLAWLGTPKETVAFALVMDDPDAGGFIHWLMYDIPGDATGLPIDLPRAESLDNGSKQGENSFGDVGYGGPCPPEGETHTYRFRVFALDEETDVPGGAMWGEVEAAIEGHVIDEGQVTATYGR